MEGKQLTASVAALTIQSVEERVIGIDEDALVNMPLQHSPQ